MTDMAFDIMTLLEELGWIGTSAESKQLKLHLIAQSMGGLIATQMLQIEQQLYDGTMSHFKTVTLQNTFRTVFSYHAMPMLDTTLFLMKQVALGLASLETRMKIVLEQMFSSDYVEENFDDLYKRYSHMFDNYRLVGGVKQTMGIMTYYISESDFIKAYNRVDKVILVNSKKDRFVSYRLNHNPI